ncbi:dihydroxyacetone kinase subunit DhaL [Microbacterium sp. Leaf179]|uniref:dihydroxyacetone kinase subunit DhaL n=1 Tax=Microbacterium sp. Leaf179 TaxID=1736288 RepID=UPI0009E73FB1|nr:dihydroxyacetone kinase subunit DhaL [Microbacterium sp. Leaf179]
MTSDVAESSDPADCLTGEHAASWLHHFHVLVASREEWLTELDTAIGDADHGVIMRQGAAAVSRAILDQRPTGVGATLSTAGSAFASTAGGAGGILFATFFQGLAAALTDRTTVSLVDFANAFSAGVTCVQARGRADFDDKTMIDALLPAAHTLQVAAADELSLPEAFTQTAAAAAAGRDATFALVARRGRASYLGDRSANHLDPGAATAALLLEALASTNRTSIDPHQKRKTTMSNNRQFINQPDDVIGEALEGLVATHPTLLTLDSASQLISRAQKATGKVGLLSGGGSGHEPLHAGFVGTGMLDVAVAGAVFASPTAQQVQAGTRLADNGAGVLHIVKNYTGDVLNFEIAAELAADEGVEVESVLVDDDLASDSDNDGPGRRGTAAVITVEKVCGALAEQGADLATIAAAGRDVVNRSRTLALSLDGCTHPGDTDPAFTLTPTEVEFGVGIHGERGTARIPFADADTLTERLVLPLIDSLGLTSGQPVIAIVNGLGGTYPLELSIVARNMHRILSSRGIPVARSLVGSYVTSLDMHGVSITFTVATDGIITAWDAPVRTPNLTW